MIIFDFFFLYIEFRFASNSKIDNINVIAVNSVWLHGIHDRKTNSVSWFLKVPSVGHDNIYIIFMVEIYLFI